MNANVPKLDRRRTLGFGLALAAAAVLAPSGGAAALSADDARDVARINGYLNSATSFAGSFVQIASDGTLTKGKFFIRRPGRLRFEYDPPSPLLVVSDGTWVIVQDQNLKTTDRYPLGSTPLSVILDENVDLNKGATVQSVDREPGQIRVTTRSDDQSFEGEIMLVFANEPLELRQWVVTDAQGQQTSVALREVINNLRLNNKLFTVDDNNWTKGR